MSPDVLTNGRWMPDGMIRRWAPAPEPPTEPPRHPSVDEEACPTCGAKAGETCRTRHGHRTRNHAARTTPRLCRCGAELGWKRWLCDQCRYLNSRDQRRSYKHRQSTKGKAA